MPYFSIETDTTIDEASNRELLKKTSDFIADLLGKPKDFVMISIKPGTPMDFGGYDDPAAFVRLKSIGLPRDRCQEFSARICGFIQEELGIFPHRVFIEFKDLEREMFGWKGDTF